MFVQMHMPTQLRGVHVCALVCRNLVLGIKSRGLSWEFRPYQCICTLQLVQTTHWDGRPCEAGLGSGGWSIRHNEKISQDDSANLNNNRILKAKQNKIMVDYERTKR